MTASNAENRINIRQSVRPERKADAQIGRPDPKHSPVPIADRVRSVGLGRAVDEDDCEGAVRVVSVQPLPVPALPLRDGVDGWATEA